MKKNNKFLLTSAPVVIAVCSLFAFGDSAFAAARVPTRGTPAARKTTTAVKADTTTVKESVSATNESVSESVENDFVIVNKSDQFQESVSAVLESAASDNSFAEQIRRQRASLAADAASLTVSDTLKSGVNACDQSLRKCMMETCGNDFTKCALDGDTVFGDKLNKCRRDTSCGAHEFSLFSAEIKADRDLNARLSSFESVLECGNNYNACIMNECGTTYNKCLGKVAEDAAIKKCETIAKNCKEADSGLAARFSTAVGQLRVRAEMDVAADEKRLYDLRDLMASQCKSLGAMFDERSFDCVFSINFFAGDNQDTPTASRKAYAGDSFICMQEWFGINATTFKENAYRETRAQTAASSAMLGSGVGTAAGLISSGAIQRAVETQKAKKELKKEEKAQELDDKTQKQNDCTSRNGTWKASACYCGNIIMTKNDKCGADNKIERGAAKTEHKDGIVCTGKIPNATYAVYQDNECIAKNCKKGFKPSEGGKTCSDGTNNSSTTETTPTGDQTATQTTNNTTLDTNTTTTTISTTDSQPAVAESTEENLAKAKADCDALPDKEWLANTCVQNPFKAEVKKEIDKMQELVSKVQVGISWKNLNWVPYKSAPKEVQGDFRNAYYKLVNECFIIGERKNQKWNEKMVGDTSTCILVQS